LDHNDKLNEELVFKQTTLNTDLIIFVA